MYRHVSVLIQEVQQLAAPLSGGGTFLDCTLGGGGHTLALLELAGSAWRGIGVDRDIQALEAARLRLAAYDHRMRFVHARFGQVADLLQPEDQPLRFVLADIGVSSHQLDESSRGFSLMHEGPLDMRMDQSQGETAEQLIRRLSTDQLAELLARFGEVSKAREIAARIRDGVTSGGIRTTVQLADLIRFGFARGKTGPVAQVFQALRIAVNGELEELSLLLSTIPGLLAPGGRFAVICFHSLEEKLAGQAFNKLAKTGEYRQVIEKRLTPTEQEVQENVRARSGSLRCIERVS